MTLTRNAKAGAALIVTPLAAIGGRGTARSLAIATCTVMTDAFVCSEDNTSAWLTSDIGNVRLLSAVRQCCS